MTAFNPFIPSERAGLEHPAAFFEIELSNPRRRDITFSVCLSLRIPFPRNRHGEPHRKDGSVSLIRPKLVNLTAEEGEFGDMCVATDAS